MDARQNLSPKQNKRYNLEREALKSLASQAALQANVSLALASGTNLRHILQKCAEAIVKHVEAAFARVWLLNDDEDVLELQASAGMYTRINGTRSRIAVGKLEVGYIAQKKISYLNNDIANDSRIDDKKWANRKGLKAFAGYPLAIGRRVIGVIGVFFKHPISQAILDTLGSVADAIAHGIERIRAEEGLRQLAGQLLQSQDQERRRIADDLHNITGQNLVALQTSLYELRRIHPSSPNWRKLIIRCEKVAKQCLAEIRTLSYVLYPPMLDKFGLEDAIREYLEGFGKRSGIRVRVRVQPNLGRFNLEAELVLFRVVQESLTNIQKHSRSKWVEIRIERQKGKIMLEVRDKGPSITTQRSDKVHPAGVGIASLQERTRQIGGRLDIKFSNVGTTVRVIIPT
jgi:signal transduction histidine kinase